MGIIRKSITFTEQQDTYIKSLIEKGFYTNDSEYVRDIIRKDQENRKNGIDLYDALADGIESGSSNETVNTIWEQAIKDNEGKN